MIYQVTSDVKALGTLTNVIR